MLAVQRLVNRSAVRQAFHGQDIRLPRNFFEDLDQSVYATLRRISEGEVEIEVKEEDQDPDRDFVKTSVVKEAIRGALGKNRVASDWVAYLNGVIAAKVNEAIKQETASMIPAAVPVPSPVLRFVLRSCRKDKDARFAPEGEFRVSRFFRLWQRPEFREEWNKRFQESKPRKIAKAGAR